MMTTEHDEALVKRVMRAMMDERGLDATRIALMGENSVQSWMNKARAVIYPPAPPKTRLQVARELLAKCYSTQSFIERCLNGDFDNDIEMKVVLEALALPAMDE